MRRRTGDRRRGHGDEEEDRSETAGVWSIREERGVQGMGSGETVRGGEEIEGWQSENRMRLGVGREVNPILPAWAGGIKPG